MRYGWPEHWIEVLDKRIMKLDIKEYSRKKHFDEGAWKGFDVELLEGPTSRYGQERLADPKLAELRFNLKRKPRRGKSNVTQMHYARRGIVTPEMEVVAIREACKALATFDLVDQAPDVGHPCIIWIPC